ncbi:MAG: formate/nitrite transporter family protein [Raoultibacter sp.]
MAMLDEQAVKTLKPDALAPAAIEAKAEEIAVGKTKLSVGKTFVLALLAGAFIAFGALYFCVFLGDPSIPFAVQRIVGGLCFCLGLVLVLCCGAELFTGNMLMTTALLSKKITAGALLKNWGIVWVGNFVGALIVVFLVFMAHTASMNGGQVGTAMINVALSKVTPDWITLFFKGILCNILVCLAVWIGFSARTVVDKVVGILLPISAFVACGFEHCVANMFFLPMAFVLKITGFSTAVDATALDMGSLFANISAATLGNIVGAVVFVAAAYWFVYRKPAA